MWQQQPCRIDIFLTVSCRIKTIDTVDEACALIETELDSMPTELDATETPLMMPSGIEEEALKIEEDRFEPRASGTSAGELAGLKEEYAGSEEVQWENEKTSEVRYRRSEKRSETGQ